MHLLPIYLLAPSPTAAASSGHKEHFTQECLPCTHRKAHANTHCCSMHAIWYPDLHITEGIWFDYYLSANRKGGFHSAGDVCVFVFVCCTNICLNTKLHSYRFNRQLIWPPLCPPCLFWLVAHRLPWHQTVLSALWPLIGVLWSIRHYMWGANRREEREGNAFPL